MKGIMYKAERLAAEERERAKRERRCPECGNKVLPFYFEMRSVEASFSFEVYQCAAKKIKNEYMVDYAYP